MRVRGAALQGGLAAAGLILAYFSWQKEPEKAPGQVEVIEASKSDILKIRFEDGPKFTEIFDQAPPAGDDEDANRMWIRVSAKNDKMPAPERLLRGNDSSAKLVERFAPLRAARALGVLTPEKAKEFGFGEGAQKKRIEVTLRGEKRSFTVGTSPFGVSDPYVRDERDNRVYVLTGNVLSDLENASARLIDRSLHVWKVNGFDALTITQPATGKKAELVQRPSNSVSADLMRKAAPTKIDQTSKNWHDKLWRLPVAEALGQGELPPGGAPQILARLDYSRSGKPVGFVEIARANTAPTTPDAPGAPPKRPDLYARSEHTVSWSRLSYGGEDVVKDLEKVLAGE